MGRNARTETYDEGRGQDSNQQPTYHLCGPSVRPYQGRGAEHCLHLRDVEVQRLRLERSGRERITSMPTRHHGSQADSLDVQDANLWLENPAYLRAPWLSNITTCLCETAVERSEDWINLKDRTGRKLTQVGWHLVTKPEITDRRLDLENSGRSGEWDVPVPRQGPA